ncbi:MAG TPA: iron-sulfur cluster assembly protein [Bacteroidia bacterium]|nr:iron-sulfur cluster assembly protein [Bacteroidia bacterium]HRS59901.1 iron-sulfur cluster assembly protein [Bacteroidia bacterium]HRU68669.1 iron-sulfur cluster assembly protein [Bacteroidia bacterium]
MKKDELKDKVTEVLKTVYDPEIPVNIYELGLIYELQTDDEGKVKIIMTLTAPACPIAEDIVKEVREKVSALEGVTVADVELTFEPPWDMSKMSLEAKIELGFI